MKNQNDAYRAPRMVELGDVLELTRGTGTSDLWDIGSGRKTASGGGGSGPDPDNQGGP